MKKKKRRWQDKNRKQKIKKIKDKLQKTVETLALQSMTREIYRNIEVSNRKLYWRYRTERYENIMVEF